jgi:hypothetical protein
MLYSRRLIIILAILRTSDLTKLCGGFVKYIFYLHGCKYHHCCNYVNASQGARSKKDLRHVGLDDRRGS